MRKITEIDISECDLGFDHMPRSKLTFDSRRNRRKWHYSDKFMNTIFPAGALKVLNKYDWRIRPHPMRKTTIEVFLDVDNIEESDYTLLRLYFKGVK